MSNIFNLLFFVIISSNFICKANDPVENPNVFYKDAVVQLDFTEKPTDTMVVVNKKSTVGVSDPFTKYALFDSEDGGYFKAESVKFKDTQLTADGTPVTLSYVYDVYTYWKDDQLLVLVFRYYYSGSRSYYKYFRRAGEVWTEVQGRDFNANSYGMLPEEDLTKLLNDTADKNPEEGTTNQGQDTAEKSGLSTNTKVVLGVVLGFVVLLLLVGLVFFLKR